MLRARKQEKEEAELTFQPKLVAKAPKHILGEVRGRLLIQRDPEGYMEWALRKMEDFEAWRAAELQKRAIEELRECTHNPETKPTPEYVQRLAKSRQARDQDGLVSRSGRDRSPDPPRWVYG